MILFFKKKIPLFRYNGDIPLPLHIKIAWTVSQPGLLNLPYLDTIEITETIHLGHIMLTKPCSKTYILTKHLAHTYQNRWSQLRISTLLSISKLQNILGNFSSMIFFIHAGTRPQWQFLTTINANSQCQWAWIYSYLVYWWSAKDILVL